ncbi:hypothetical protein [Microbacterium ulmi]|uniref:Small CPxCG-related zinc finger protein n=1 Tax=Microbacterium ulmi TaxID=179095 RepID=A0A7Y2LWU3_9MICO|nr:hypothetical protein [Microbacterium ulmi]NII68221.1 hypothetical protein [Microbacterium ulmi]NNH02301.1 hypothetical protein [Microbacterium ulmi]
MTRTWDDVAPHAAAEVCPVCASLDVRATEPGWFVLELDRGDELRRDEVAVEFVCRDCRATWR